MARDEIIGLSSDQLNKKNLAADVPALEWRPNQGESAAPGVTCDGRVKTPP